MKKMRLWTGVNMRIEQEGKAMLIYGEVEKKIDCRNDMIIIEGDYTLEQVEKVFKTFEGAGIHDVQDHLDEHLPGATASYTKDFEDADERIVFDQGGIYQLEDYETVLVYDWFDGSNRRYEVNDENYASETILEVFEESINLDEWDGRNHVTGGTGHHQLVYRVYTVDGEEVTDTYLVEYWSQWQGDHATGELMNSRELEQHLEEIGRDVEEYMKEVAELGN